MDQGVEAFFLSCALFECGAFDVGGSYGLVCFLSAFGLGVVAAHVQIAFAELSGDFSGYCGNGFFGEVQRVGTHVGDVAVFVEALRHHHGL